MTTTSHVVVGERTKLAFTKALSVSVLSRLQSGAHDPDDLAVASHRASLQRSGGSPPPHRGRIYSAKYGLSDADEQ